ncbi:MAG TPA: cob(I)yrinic acid a,c-diamide adenosyltransferase [Bacilli bacterium]
MKIYTKQGDNLKTKTINNEVYKSDLIIEVNGTIDELQAHLMLSYNFIDNQEIKEIILSICKDLFIVGYDITSSKETFSIDKVTSLELLIDKYNDTLKPLTEFIVPGLTKPSSILHVTRTVARRCERVIVRYALDHDINKAILKYINRLSDLLFILARFTEEYK